MHVLVTGAAGFIGAAVTESLLARGDSVVGIDNFDDYYSPALKEARRDRVQAAYRERFRFVRADLRDGASLEVALGDEPLDRIIHLGARPGVRASLEQPIACIETNVLGHVAMLELARRRAVSHFVYASSSSVYGGNDEIPFSPEHRARRPLSLYAASKRADELISETYAHVYRLPQTGLRFFTVYGPWGRPDMMMWIFTRKILAGEPLPLFNSGESWRDFTYIDDIVAGVLGCLDRPPVDDSRTKPGGSLSPHALYNIGNSRMERVRDVIGVLERACGREAILSLQPPQPGDALRTHADISAMTADFGYEPTTPIEAGVPRFVDWYRAHSRV